MKAICSICAQSLNPENAAILTMGRYGNPKCICESCEALLDTATLGDDYEKISEACEKLGKTFADFGNQDDLVIDKMSEILNAAATRASEIKSGTHDFSRDTENGAEENFEITDELRELEEDRLLDEKEQKQNKRLDTIISWISGLALIGAVIFLIIRFIL